MPTILRHRGFEIAVRPRDHGPPHVHIMHGGEEVVILLGVGIEVPRVRENRGMRLRKVRAAMNIVSANNEAFLKEWRKIHA